MILRLFIITLIIISPRIITAQICLCCKKRESGQTAYNQGDYKTALARWQEGTKLSDAVNCPDLIALMAKARRKINAPKPKLTSTKKEKSNSKDDLDEDGIIDIQDECPTQYGPRRFQGCPDQDGDDLPDHKDNCPDIFGPKRSDGCPDRDGDGIADKDDKCPDVVGEIRWQGCLDIDGDGISDYEDKCPDEKGNSANGCPFSDRDMDGIPDQSDRCPDMTGMFFFQGCPDTDGDSIPDIDDKCPTEKGLELTGGCPKKIELENMVLLTGGSFDMGNNFSETDRNEKKANDYDIYYNKSEEIKTYKVTLNDFFIGKKEITFDEYDAYCIDVGIKIPSDLGRGRGQLPVINITWLNAIMYCNWLSKKNSLTPCYIYQKDNINCDWNANGYRLPTEAEWEYAARSGGNKEKWAGTSDRNVLKRFANIVWQDDGYSYTAPVASFQANEKGLFDMSGNVWEWCWDKYGKLSSNPATNPHGSDRGKDRVRRGGSYNTTAIDAMCSERGHLVPESRAPNIGFRLAKSIN